MSEKFEARLGLNTKEYDAKLRKSKTGMQKFGDSLKAIGAAMAAAFSVGVLVNFGKEIIGLASKIEGVDFRVSETGGLAGLSDELRKFQAQANEIKLKSTVGQEIVALKTEALSTGQEIAKVLDTLATGKVSKIRFSVFDKDTKKEADEIYKLFIKTADKVREGIKIPDTDFKKITKHLKDWNLLSDVEQVNVQKILDIYSDKISLLSDEDKIREKQIEKAETLKDYEEDIVLAYEKQQTISNLVLKD